MKIPLALKEENDAIAVIRALQDKGDYSSKDYATASQNLKRATRNRQKAVRETKKELELLKSKVKEANEKI